MITLAIVETWWNLWDLCNNSLRHQKLTAKIMIGFMVDSFFEETNQKLLNVVIDRSEGHWQTLVVSLVFSWSFHLGMMFGFELTTLFQSFTARNNQTCFFCRIDDDRSQQRSLMKRREFFYQIYRSTWPTSVIKSMRDVKAFDLIRWATIRPKRNTAL